MISVCMYLPTYQLGIGVMTLKLDIVIIVYMRIKAKGISSFVRNLDTSIGGPYICLFVQYLYQNNDVEVSRIRIRIMILGMIC